MRFAKVSSPPAILSALSIILCFSAASPAQQVYWKKDYVYTPGGALVATAAPSPDPDQPTSGITYYNTSASSCEWCSSLSFSHAHGPGDNGMVIFAVATQAAGQTITNVTFNGDSDTEVVQLQAAANYQGCYIGALPAPDVGTFTVEVTASGSTTWLVAAAMSFHGVKQSGYVDDTDSREQSGVSDAGLTALTSNAGNTLAVDCLSSTADFASMVPETNRVQRHNQVMPGADAVAFSTVLPQPAPGSMPFAWDLNDDESYAQTGAVFLAAGSSGGGGGITFGSAGGGLAVNSDVVSFPVTVPAGSNTVMLVGLLAEEWQAVASATSVTFDGIPLTAINSYSHAGSFRCELWFLKNPSTGAHTFSASFSSAQSNLAAGVMLLHGVKQDGLPYRDATQGGGYAGQQPTVSVSTQPNDWVVDVLNLWYAALEPSPGGGQTERLRVDDGQDDALLMSTKTAEGSPTAMTWDKGQSDTWHAQCAASLIPAQ